MRNQELRPVDEMQTALPPHFGQQESADGESTESRTSNVSGGLGFSLRATVAWVLIPCGDNSRVRLIAAMGDDRNRYGSAGELASASGIAPLTTQSGKQRYVSSRWACTKSMKQAFHEFAGITITRSRWAKAYYDDQITKGKSAQMAKRALAFKWIRILYSCWKERTPYDEAKYIQRLIETNSPLAERLKNTSDAI